MRYTNPFAPFPREPYFQTDGGGAGAGGAAAGGGAGAGGAAGAAAAAAGGAGAAGAAAAGAGMNISDDTPVTIGGKTYGSFKEYQQQFVPRSEHENFQKNYRTELRQNLARLAQSIQRTGGQGQGGGRPVADPFAEVWNSPIIDGKQLKQLADAGFGSLAQRIDQQQREMAAIKKQIGSLSGGYGTLAERNLHSDFERRIDATITATVGEESVKDPFLRELAEDVWHSHENWTRGKEDQEFQEIFKKRFDAMEKFFRASDKRKLEAAKTRRWVRPGGNGTPSGLPKFDPKRTNRDAAAALFGTAPQNT
jgi:hypothetical protein